MFLLYDSNYLCIFSYYFSYFFSWFVFYLVQDLIRILKSFDVMSPSDSRGANAEANYILDGLNKCGHFGWTCCFPAPWRNNIPVLNKYIFETWIANISQQCHNKFVSIKTVGGGAPSSSLLGHWSSSVLTTEKQEAWQGRKRWRETFTEEEEEGDGEYGSHRGTWWERWRQTCCSILAAFQRQRCSLWTNKYWSAKYNISLRRMSSLDMCWTRESRAGDAVSLWDDPDLQGSPPEGGGSLDHTRVRSVFLFD